jgi:UPF0716 family protein affecting phage T7 exclusion
MLHPATSTLQFAVFCLVFGALGGFLALLVAVAAAFAVAWVARKVGTAARDPASADRRSQILSPQRLPRNGAVLITGCSSGIGEGERFRVFRVAAAVSRSSQTPR